MHYQLLNLIAVIRERNVGEIACPFTFTRQLTKNSLLKIKFIFKNKIHFKNKVGEVKFPSPIYTRLPSVFFQLSFNFFLSPPCHFHHQPQLCMLVPPDSLPHPKLTLPPGSALPPRFHRPLYLADYQHDSHL